MFQTFSHNVTALVRLLPDKRWHPSQCWLAYWSTTSKSSLCIHTVFQLVYWAHSHPIILQVCLYYATVEQTKPWPITAYRSISQISKKRPLSTRSLRSSLCANRWWIVWRRTACYLTSNQSVGWVSLWRQPYFRSSLAYCCSRSMKVT